MIQLLGEYVCKLDSKGRLVVPAGLKKQLPNVEQDGLILNRGIEKHLAIYPKQVWEELSAEVNKLSRWEEKNREFKRFFFRGINEISLDSASRILIPKFLLDYAGIDVGGEVILTCQSDVVEIWSKAAYDKMLDNEPENFARLAEEVMGGKDRRDGDGR